MSLPATSCVCLATPAEFRDKCDPKQCLLNVQPPNYSMEATCGCENEPDEDMRGACGVKGCPDSDFSHPNFSSPLAPPLPESDESCSCGGEPDAYWLSCGEMNCLYYDHSGPVFACLCPPSRPSCLTIMRPGYCPHNPASMRSTGSGEDPPRRVVETWIRAPFLSPLFQAAIPPEAYCLAPLLPEGEAALRAEIAKFRCMTPPDELYAEQDAYNAEQAEQAA